MSSQQVDAEKQLATTSVTVAQLDPKATQITFDDEGDLPHRRARPLTTDAGHRSSIQRRRSISRSSINSVRSRSQQGNWGVPIGYRTLSIEASQSRADLERDLKNVTKPKVKPAGTTDFGTLNEHTLPVEEICSRLGVSPTVGLNESIAADRRREDGPNTLPRQKTNYLRKILGYVFGGFCSILWVGVIIFFICWRPLGDPDPAPYNLGLAVLVIVVILLQASFSAFQDWSTARTMNSILDMLPSDAAVLRNGSWTKISTKDLVKGDIVHITIGNKVPADLRLIETSGDVRFDRSAMTGESEEVEGSVDSTDENYLESKNIALMGTVVTNGTATGVVLFTGSRTVMGAIATATSDVKAGPTAIQKEITRFVTIICGLTVLLALLILFTWVGWLRRDHFAFINVVDMLDDVMGCVVAFIPEGMPVGVALTLMMIARRMKKANVLPKSLATVETLGCVQVICSDKTGTLTKNRMTVTTVAFSDNSLDTSSAREAFSSEKSSVALQELCRAAHLCNEASFDALTLNDPIDERLTQGNATDGAVLRFAESLTAGKAMCDSYPQVAQIPFNSKNKFMLTMHRQTTSNSTEKGSNYLLIVKGAPDILMAKCSFYRSFEDGEVKPLTQTARQAFTDVQMKMASNAERVILLCQRDFSPSSAIGSNDLTQELLDHSVSGLTAIGMLGIFDPPRPETASTVALCRRAGIRFFMMTGDFGLTGAAIARQTGIFTEGREIDTFSTIENNRESPQASSDDLTLSTERSLLLDGVQISALEKDDWDVVCRYQEIVFGRCTPEHKLRIINELKSRGYTTAVTGDGVNDAPALKAADVGIAMVNGSDVALEAADLVLLDQFSSIIDGIRLGRLVFQNLQKVISYLLPAGSWSEIWPVILNVFFGVPLPLSSFLMIIICVFTDLFLSLSLIMEKEEFDLMSIPPRERRKEHLINLKIYAQSYLFIGVMETVIAHSMYFLYYWRYAGIPMSALWFAFENYSDGFYGYSQDDLNNFNIVGQSVYFVTLVILQWGNILSIRNKRLSILQADPIRKQRRNPWLVLSVLMSLAIAIFVTEEPGLQNLFGTASIPLEFWFIPIPLAVGILTMDELRKLCVRLWPTGVLARIAW